MKKKRSPPRPPVDLATIGWREWIQLPDLGVRRVKAKVDTGARSSSLHASQIEIFEQDGQQWVRFHIHPLQRHPEKFQTATAPLIDLRIVRSSSGKATERPVIRTPIGLLGKTWEVDLTLANRMEMGFRMLLGREAFRGRFLVDAGNSYYGGAPARKKRKPAP